MGINNVQFSKAVSHALRHEPWLYELEPDETGWVLIEDLLSALRRQRQQWKGLNEKHLAAMIKSSSKTRFELADNKIRAYYGHSLPGKLQKVKAMPPDKLFHGTSHSALGIIMSKGLMPMSRQYVHLSSDLKTARLVGRRKDKNPVILVINAKAAHEKGIAFYIGNQAVWLADIIPPDFIQLK